MSLRTHSPGGDATRPIAVLLVVLVVALGGLGFATMPAAASTNATIDASPNDPGEDSTHRATATVGPDRDSSSLTGFEVDYSVASNPADVSNVGQNDVQAVGIDTNNDGTIETDVSSNLTGASASNNGETLTFSFDGSTSIYENDTVIVEYADAQNPGSTGTFDVDISINPQSDPVNTSTASLTIAGTAPTATITANPAMEGNESTHTVDRGIGSANHNVSLTDFTVEYAATDATGLSASDVSTAGLDTDGDGTVEEGVNVTGVTVSNGGATVTFSFDGSTTVESGEHLLLTYGEVTNPPTDGDHSVTTTFDGTDVGATLSIDPAPEPDDEQKEETKTINETEPESESDRTLDAEYPMTAEAWGGNPKLVVDVDHANYGEPVDVALPKESVNGAYLDGISFMSRTTGNYELAFYPNDTVADPIRPLAASGDREALAYYRTTATVDATEVSNVTVTMTVNEAALDGRSPEAASLYRYTFGGWSPVETTYLGPTDDGTAHRYSAAVTSVSYLAIGVGTPDLAVTETVLADQSLAPGASTTVTAEVTNEGSAAGNRTVELRAGGDVHGAQTVSLEPGEAQYVSLSAAFEEPGSYDVRVGDADAGTVTVERPTTETMTTTEPTTAEPTTTETTTTGTVAQTDRDGGSAITFLSIGGAALLAITGVAYSVRTSL